MWRIIKFSLTTLLFYFALYPCSIVNRESVQVGSFPAIRGECSNNGLSITCVLMEGVGVECDGPSGGYTGYDLNYLVFAACGCSLQEEQERRIEREFEEE